ncbi:MAG: type I methionyl aminopeptidase [Patescibacteria group bacterium]|jgi:methionyl aminopeptidase
MTKLKSQTEINALKEGGRILAEVLRKISEVIKPGTKAGELDALAEKLIRKAGAEPAFKGYQDYPATLCVSVNSEVVHGIPGHKIFKNGDIVGLDCGLKYKNLYTDAALTVGVGKISKAAARLIEVTEDSFWQGVKAIKAGVTTGDIGHAIQAYAEANGFNVVRALVGHGVGRQVHEDPKIPNYGAKGMGVKLEAGTIIAVEPMLTEGGYEVATASDHWTVVTADGGLAAHYEHTILVTEKGSEIITKL